VIEALLLVAVCLVVYQVVRGRVARKAALAFALEMTFLIKAARRVAQELEDAPPLENMKQCVRHGRWASELVRAAHLAETYYHLSIKLGTTSQWEKEHGAGTRQDIRVRGDLPPAEEVEGRGSEEV
jgi:hypothetical protein